MGRVGRHILNLVRNVQLVQKAHDGGRPGTAGFPVEGYFHINRASFPRWTATSLSDAQMIRTGAVASSRKENSHDDGGDVDACTTISRKIAAKYAIRQQQRAGNKPEYPSRIEEPAASA